MNELVVYPDWQTTRLLVFDPRSPRDIFDWLLPERIHGDWGYELVDRWYKVWNAQWLPTEEGGLKQFYEKPNFGSFETVVTPADGSLRARITVENLSGHAVRDISGFLCWAWRQAPNFYPGALERTCIEVDGELTPILETDRRASLDGLMPVYPVEGEPGPANWEERVSRAYGWGLSRTKASSPFIGLESADGEWAAAVWFQNAYRVSFNAKPPYHGCTHSDPFLGAAQAGARVTAEGAVYLVPGSLRDLYRRVKDEWTGSE